MRTPRVGRLGERAERQRAPAAEPSHETAFGLERDPARRVVERRRAPRSSRPSDARACTARQPWPGRGHHLGESTSAPRARARRRAAAARPPRGSAASASPSASLRSRVSTLPRRSFTITSGPPPEHLRPAADARRPDARARAAARRRGSPARRAPRRARARRRSRRPRRPRAGRSFAECTARSTSPSRSARTISVDEQALHPGRVARRVGAPVAGGRDRHELGLDAVRGAVRRRPRSPGRARASSGASRSGASLARGARARTARRAFGRTASCVPAPGRLLQPHDRVVQELGDDAARERLDGLALLGLERGQVGAEALELGVDGRVAALAQRAEERAEPLGAGAGS